MIKVRDLCTNGMWYWVCKANGRLLVNWKRYLAGPWSSIFSASDFQLRCTDCVWSSSVAALVNCLLFLRRWVCCVVFCLRVTYHSIPLHLARAAESCDLNHTFTFLLDDELVTIFSQGMGWLPEEAFSCRVVIFRKNAAFAVTFDHKLMKCTVRFRTKNDIRSHTSQCILCRAAISRYCFGETPKKSECSKEPTWRLN